WLVHEAGIEAPYVITPPELTGPAWRNPPPFRHGTPEANNLYAQIVYQGLAELLGWPRLGSLDERARVEVYDLAGAGSRGREAEEILRQRTRSLPDGFRPSRESDGQCVGPMDCATGLMGRATTILVRRRDGATVLRVAVRALREVASLYPLGIRVSIPGPSPGREHNFTVEPVYDSSQVFSLPLPNDIPIGAAVDVQIHAERVMAALDSLDPRSIVVEAIEQE
ncbi:MAG: hypothetical protein ACRENB_12840, partial [Gemmatimonadales bacterium]